MDLIYMTDCMQSLAPRNVKLRELRVVPIPLVAMGANPGAPHASMGVVWASLHAALHSQLYMPRLPALAASRIAHPDPSRLVVVYT